MPSRRGDGKRCSVTAYRLGAVMRVRGVPREIGLLCDSLYDRVDLVIVTMCTVCLYDVVFARVAVHNRYRYDNALLYNVLTNLDATNVNIKYYTAGYYCRDNIGLS